MGQKIWLAAFILPLSGCYVPPSGPAYAPQPGYGSPGYGYGAPAYGSPGYPPPYDPYSSYSYDNGAPAIVEGGVSVPLVLFGGQWGYYDHDRHFHRAPDNVGRDIENRRASGNFRPNPGLPGGGGPQPWHGQPNGQAAFHPGGPPPGQPSGPPLRAAPQPQPQQRPEGRHECPPGQHC